MQQPQQGGPIYNCVLADGTGTAGPRLTAWFQAWASSQGIALEPGTLNLCADRDVLPPSRFLSLRPWDAALQLQFRKQQTGYDPRLYPIVLEGSQRAWLFRWSHLTDLHNFVGDTPSCTRLRRCEVIAEVNLTNLWNLNVGSTLSLLFA